MQHSRTSSETRQAVLPARSERSWPTCLLFVEPQRVWSLMCDIPKDAVVHQVSDNADLCLLLDANPRSLVIIDPARVSDHVAEVLGRDVGGWSVVADTTTTGVGLAALWKVLCSRPACIILRDHERAGWVSDALCPGGRAGDELLRAWAEALSRLPVELSRAVVLAVSGAEKADRSRPLPPLLAEADAG